MDAEAQVLGLWLRRSHSGGFHRLRAEWAEAEVPDVVVCNVLALVGAGFGIPVRFVFRRSATPGNIECEAFIAEEEDRVF